MNYVDSVTGLYPIIRRCLNCKVVIRCIDGRWLDGASAHWCQSGPALMHTPAPYVARSPTLGGLT